VKEIIESRSINSHNIATVFHDANSQKVVIFCHGYRAISIGPNRFIVLVARKLAEAGISSLRFDQYGSGNSEGDFFDSSFIDWVKTTNELVKDYLSQGFQVALLGQSMGGATVIDVASQVDGLAAVVAWVPDPNVEEFVWPDSGVIEENGQTVKATYWQEAHDETIANKLTKVRVPTYIVQCSEDEYVSDENRHAITQNLQPNHKEITFEGYKHSNWTYAQAEPVIRQTVDFLIARFS
jgi:uncharacterized protein